MQRRRFPDPYIQARNRARRIIRHCGRYLEGHAIGQADLNLAIRIRRRQQHIDRQMPGRPDKPGNRLHPLGDELAGFHAIGVNDQYRIIFRFEGEHAFDVRCTDYH